MVVFVQKSLYLSKVVLIRQKRFSSGKNDCIREKEVVIWLNAEVIGQKLLYSCKSACFLAKVVVLGQSGCIRAKWFYFGKNYCIQAKVVVLG